jgi:hypothetical protein
MSLLNRRLFRQYVLLYSQSRRLKFQPRHLHKSPHAHSQRLLLLQLGVRDVVRSLYPSIFEIVTHAVSY